MQHAPDDVANRELHGLALLEPEAYAADLVNEGRGVRVEGRGHDAAEELGGLLGTWEGSCVWDEIVG